MIAMIILIIPRVEIIMKIITGIKKKVRSDKQIKINRDAKPIQKQKRDSDAQIITEEKSEEER